MYKYLKSEIALTLKLWNFYCYDSNCRKLLILECSFTWCKLLILLMFVYDKNKDTPFCIESMAFIIPLWTSLDKTQSYRKWPVTFFVGSKSSGEAYDLNVYRVQEYFSYNEFSFYDVEKDMAISRLTQPDPKQEYVHSNPWKSSAWELGTTPEVNVSPETNHP